jgi:hypothetical protein
MFRSVQIHALLSFLLLALLVIACNNSTTPDPSDGFTISGIIMNSDGTTSPASIPLGARVMMLWDARDSSGDIGIVGEEGTIDRAKSTFSITLPVMPPNDQLYAPRDGQLFGVGFIALTTDTMVYRGMRSKDFGGYHPKPILGGADNNAVVFREGTFTSRIDSTFEQGYSLAQTVRVPQVTMDWFKPIPNQPIILRLDTGSNLRFANWH